MFWIMIGQMDWCILIDLQQMSKNTDSTHPDSFHITNALETMKQMINVLNDSIQNSCKLAYSSTLHKNVKRR